MVNLSFIEFVVYGLIAYSSLLMLIISIVKEIPDKRAMSIARSIFLLPGMVCAGILANSGVNITWVTSDTITKDLNSSTVWSENVTQYIALSGPVWAMVHYMIFIVLLFFIAMQIMIFFTKTE